MQPTNCIMFTGTKVAQKYRLIATSNYNGEGQDILPFNLFYFRAVDWWSPILHVGFKKCL